MPRSPVRSSGLARFERGLDRGLAVTLAGAHGVTAPGRVEVLRVARRAGRWSAADLRVHRPGRAPLSLVVLATTGALPKGVEPLDLSPPSPLLPDEVRVGAFPLVRDPRLPGLATASSRVALGELLGAEVVHLQRRRYRHLERAVVRAELSDGTVRWVKVLRPDRAVGLAARHRLLGEHLRVPEVVTLDEARGLVVLSDLDGVPLRALARAPTPDRAWPTPDDLDDLSDRLLAAHADGPVLRRPPLGALVRNARHLAEVLPEASDRVARLATRLRERARPRQLRHVTVHGDLHAGQILCVPGRPPGLLDLDDAGLGDPLDDRTRLVGHLVGTVESRPTDHGRALLTELAERRVARAGDDAVVRIAAVLVGQAIGPHRVGGSGWRAHSLHRLATAERWADGDRRLRPV